MTLYARERNREFGKGYYKTYNLPYRNQLTVSIPYSDFRFIASLVDDDVYKTKSKFVEDAINDLYEHQKRNSSLFKSIIENGHNFERIKNEEYVL